MEPTHFLITVSGKDRAGLASSVFAGIADAVDEITDVGQITIRGHLVLCVEVTVSTPTSAQNLVERVRAGGISDEEPIQVTVTPTTDRRIVTDRRVTVTLLAERITAGQLTGVFAGVSKVGGDVERIVRLADYPVQSYEVIVRDAPLDELRTIMGEVAVEQELDIAVQLAGLHRRAKRLVVMDVDSTLLQGEVIDELAAQLGHQAEVAAITQSAMAGEIDFEASLRARVKLLAGLDEAEVVRVARQVELAPGARTLLRTLRRLGFQTGVVSGGFSQVTDALMGVLGIDFGAANQLEVVDGKLTGNVVGEIIDRSGKAAKLIEFAGRAGIPLDQTVAVGDGANDIDMLSVAGLGIAFNARPVVREAADTALNVPYLDAVLFLLGISRDEIEAADRAALQDQE
jgi:phosphoserine phosphatase